MPTLDWIGKSAVVSHHKKVPFRLLKCRADLSVGDPDSGNLLVQGDNLEALKALLPYYAGKVKCIYIDPPYNTGNEGWVYNDNVNSPEMRNWLGTVVGGEAEDLSRHDKWLCMMYPRLQLLKQFLKEDGVILISIDDFECYHLRCLMDEIFGRQNFIAQLVWEKGRKNDAKFFSVGHEYMIVYAKSMDLLRKQKTVWREPKPGAQEIWNEYTKLRSTFGEDDIAIETSLRDWYKALPDKHPSKALSRYKHIDKNGPWRDRDISWPGGGGPRYDVIHPVTKLPCRVPERGWGFASTKAMQNQINLGLIEFREDHTFPPFRKAHLHPIPEELGDTVIEEEDDGENAENIGLQVMPSVIYKQSQVAVKYLRRLMGKKVFENPKDFEVIARLVRYLTQPGDIILDSFAGSGTTGHSVLQQNSEDGGGRRFILIEMDVNIASQITAERLKRVIRGTDDIAGVGGGFRFCELGETLFDPNNQIRPEIQYNDLAQHVYFIETGSPLLTLEKTEHPLLGVHNGAAIYLLYNGVLKDKSPQGGNVLTNDILAILPPHAGPKIIYGNACRIGEQRLRDLEIIFKQIPYDIQER